MNQYARMCRDGHVEIGFTRDVVDSEMCPLCRAANLFREIVEETPNPPRLPYAHRMIEIATNGLKTIGATLEQ